MRLIGLAVERAGNTKNSQSFSREKTQVLSPRSEIADRLQQNVDPLEAMTFGKAIVATKVEESGIHRRRVQRAPSLFRRQ